MKLSRTLTVAAAMIALAVIGTFVVLQLGGSEDSDAEMVTHECEVTIQFNTAVTQADITEAEAILRALDAKVEMIVMEIFPPIGVARLNVDDRQLCDTAVDELRGKSYVESVSWQTLDPLGVESAD
jgi:hypothetical protein